MKKIILYSLLCVFIICLFFSNITISASKEALQLWFNTLVPSFLFPLIFIRLLAPYHLLQPLLKPLNPFITFLFNMNSYAFESILTAFFLGFPSASIFMEELCQENQLNKQQYQRMIYCCFLASPNFILISLSVLYPSDITFRLLGIQLLCILVLFLFTRTTPLYLKETKQKTIFFKQLTIAIRKGFEILLMILAYLLIVYVIVNITSLFLPTFIKAPMKILSEFASGCFFINQSAIPLQYQYFIINALLSYGGLCVHMQLIASLSNTNFHYLSFIKYRIFHILLSILFSFFFFR